MLDLRPATNELIRVIGELREEQLSAATPCPGMSIAAMLDHTAGFAGAFTDAARKNDTGRRREADAALLAADWRVTIPARLVELADAWQDEAAWSGTTHAAGVALTAEAAGMFALDEVVVHAWDLAVVTGNRVEFDDAVLLPLLQFLTRITEQSPDGTPGLFGRPVPVGQAAPLLERVLGRTGRNPAWAA